MYQGIEPYTEPIPIQPTAHYAMGGVPTNLAGAGDPRRGQHRGARASTRRARRPACPSTARTASGTNSLVDLLVFGRRAGRQMALDIRGQDMPVVSEEVMEPVRGEIEAIRGRAKGERKEALRHELADVMMDDAGVYRDAARPRARPGQGRRAAGALRAT